MWHELGHLWQFQLAIMVLALLNRAWHIRLATTVLEMGVPMSNPLPFSPVPQPGRAHIGMLRTACRHVILAGRKTLSLRLECSTALPKA